MGIEDHICQSNTIQVNLLEVSSNSTGTYYLFSLTIPFATKRKVMHINQEPYHICNLAPRI